MVFDGRSIDTPTSEHGHLVSGGRLSLRVRHFIGSDWRFEVDDDGEPFAVDEQVPTRSPGTEAILDTARARLVDQIKGYIVTLDPGVVTDADPDNAAET